MSDPQNQQVSQRKRRPRTQSDSRNFICACGKGYLSYPALYTHIKNKHEGKAPGMIQIPKTEKSTKLRRYDFKVYENDEDNDEYEKSSKQYIQQFIKFFSVFEPYDEPYNLQQVIEKLPPEAGYCFSMAVKQWQQGKIQEQLLQNGAYNTTIERVFAKFIIQLSTKVGKNILVQIFIILHLWRKCFRQFDMKSIGVIVTNDNCEHVLEIVNILMESYFKENIPKYNGVVEEHHMLNLENTKLMNKCICKFIYLFSKWLFAERYLHSVLEVNMNAEFNVELADSDEEEEGEKEKIKERVREKNKGKQKEKQKDKEKQEEKENEEQE